MLDSLPTINYKLITEMFAAATSESLELIKSTLNFNPAARPSAEDLLRHVFVSEFHKEEEPNYPNGPLQLAIDDNVKLTAPQYRERLYQEISNRRRETRNKSKSKTLKLGGSG